MGEPSRQPAPRVEINDDALFDLSEILICTDYSITANDFTAASWDNAYAIHSSDTSLDTDPASAFSAPLDYNSFHQNIPPREEIQKEEAYKRQVKFRVDKGDHVEVTVEWVRGDSVVKTEVKSIPFLVLTVQGNVEVNLGKRKNYKSSFHLMIITPKSFNYYPFRSANSRRNYLHNLHAIASFGLSTIGLFIDECIPSRHRTTYFEDVRRLDHFASLYRKQRGENSGPQHANLR